MWHTWFFHPARRTNARRVSHLRLAPCLTQYVCVLAHAGRLNLVNESRAAKVPMPPYICNSESGSRGAARETSRRINILFRFPLRKRLKHAIYLFYFRMECSLAGPQRQAESAAPRRLARRPFQLSLPPTWWLPLPLSQPL